MDMESALGKRFPGSRITLNLGTGEFEIEVPPGTDAEEVREWVRSQAFNSLSTRAFPPLEQAPADFCQQEAEQGMEFRRRFFGLRDLSREGYALMPDDYRAIASATQQFARWAEDNLPKPCGECKHCLEEAGKCPHGWSHTDICPTCNPRRRKAQL